MRLGETSGANRRKAKIVAAENLQSRATEVAQRIAENGPLAVAACKEAVIRTSGLELEQAFPIENEISARIMRTEDAIEGPKAFMEKRKAVYKGE